MRKVAALGSVPVRITPQRMRHLPAHQLTLTQLAAMRLLAIWAENFRDPRTPVQHQSRCMTRPCTARSFRPQKRCRHRSHSLNCPVLLARARCQPQGTGPHMGAWPCRGHP